MKPATILEAVRAAGGAIFVEGASVLRIMPKACLTDALRGHMIVNKMEITALLLAEASERWMVTTAGRMRVVATVPAGTLHAMQAMYPGAHVRPLTAEQWEAFDVEQPDGAR